MATSSNGIDGDSLIESCQLAPFVNSQSEQVHVGDLSMCDERIGFEDLKDAEILIPEVMARDLTELTKYGKHGHDIPWPVWIIRVARNADKSILGERARYPGRPTFIGEPAMG